MAGLRGGCFSGQTTSLVAVMALMALMLAAWAPRGALASDAAVSVGPEKTAADLCALCTLLPERPVCGPDGTKYDNVCFAVCKNAKSAGPCDKPAPKPAPKPESKPTPLPEPPSHRRPSRQPPPEQLEPESPPSPRRPRAEPPTPRAEPPRPRAEPPKPRQEPAEPPKPNVLRSPPPMPSSPERPRPPRPQRVRSPPPPMPRSPRPQQPVKPVKPEEKPVQITKSQVKDKYYFVSPHKVESYFQSNMFCASQGGKLAEWDRDSTWVAMQQLCLAQGLDCWYDGSLIGGIFCPVYSGTRGLLTLASCVNPGYAFCVEQQKKERGPFWARG